MCLRQIYEQQSKVPVLEKRVSNSSLERQ